MKLWSKEINYQLVKWCTGHNDRRKSDFPWSLM